MDYKKYTKFNTFEEARAKMDYYNSLARHPSCVGGFELTLIKNSVDGSFWFFNYDSCILNGGLGREGIIADESNLDIHEFSNNEEMIEAGWKPIPPKPINLNI